MHFEPINFSVGRQWKLYFCIAHELGELDASIAFGRVSKPAI